MAAQNKSDEKLVRTEGEGRAPRSAEDRPITDNRETLSIEDVVSSLAGAGLNIALPDPPRIPGFHLCWLSSTNQYDTIERRMRMGYELVHPEELLGWDFVNTKSAPLVPGGVSINEMVLYKIPEPLYQRIMKELHHDAPMREEEKIKAQTEGLTDRAGKPLIKEIGDGTESIVQRARAPVTFA